MNEHAASLAALNISLLEAIKAGPAPSRQGLAEQAGVIATNLARKLNSLTEAGLIFADAADANDLHLTEEGARALAAMVALRDGAPVAEAGLTWIGFDRIDAWDLNPRTQFDPAGIEDMAQSIADQGVLQPLTVRMAGDRYQVVIGERRRRGATLAVECGWIDDPGFLLPCQVRDWSDDEALDVAGVENLQRADLHWMDEAKFYLRLAERGRSGAEIARLAGESVSKRKVQDYCMIARKLSDADIARAYLPDGDAGQLIYTRARDLAGERQPKPALDLSPALALAFGELIAAGTFDPAGRGQFVTELHAAPVGGPLAKLQERKLLTFGFGPDRRLEARIPLTEDLRPWLDAAGLATEDDRATADALHKLRAVVVGDMMSATFAAGHWHTPELNAAEAAYFAPSPASPPPSPKPEGGPDPDADVPAYLQRLAGSTPQAPPPHAGEVAAKPTEGALPAATPAPAPAPTPPEALPAMLAIVMIEAAHKIGVEGVERGPETWGAPILADFYKDARGQQLVMKRFLAFMPMGERQLVAIPKAGREWLERTQHIASPNGRPRVTDTDLRDAQAELVGAVKDGATYSTPWLNRPDPDPAATVETPPQAPPPQAGEVAAQPTEGAASEATETATPQLTAPQRALLACYGELGMLDGLLSRLRTDASKTHQAEIDQHRRLVDAIRETAQANLPAGVL